MHTRVFLNSDGNPTYEAKDLGLAVEKNKDFPEITKSIIMTANEQKDYFRVVLSALGEIDERLEKKTLHLPATEIIRIEFKGQPDFNGIVISEKPSVGMVCKCPPITLACS